MKLVELYGRVRYAVRIEWISRREAARRFGIDPRTVAKMLAFSVPPGSRGSHPPTRPKLDGFVGIIDRILEDDKGRSAKQRHTPKRIFERLRDEHGLGGGVSIAKDYVLGQRQRQREVFAPLRHDPEHAQADFSQCYERSTHTSTDHRHQQPAVRRRDWRIRLRASHRRAARPAHPPPPHPGNERRKLQAQTEQAVSTRRPGRLAAIGRDVVLLRR